MDKAPKIYADWIKVLDVLKSAEDDENALALMEKGEIVWQSGVAERFLNKIVAAMNFRLKRAIDNFQKSYNSFSNSRIIEYRDSFVSGTDFFNIPSTILKFKFE